MCLRGKRKGEILDSNSYTQMMKNLFIVFHKKRINYDYKKDVNANGEFHGVCLSVWKQGKDEDPKFGTLQNRAEMDEEADKKIARHKKKGSLICFKQSKIVSLTRISSG